MPLNIDYVNLLIDFTKAYGTKIFSALVVLIVGYFVGRWIGKVFDKTLRSRQLEPPVRILLVRIAHITILLFALLLAVQNLGIEIMPIVAGLGVAGVGIGLAMQGVLSNAMAGLTIIFSKPYRVGEYIELLGVYGEVISIDLFSTTLMHADRSLVIVPNRKIVGEILHNYGSIRQCDFSVGIAYSADVKRAIEVINEILKSNELILREPVPIVGVATLADSSIQIAVRPWAAVKNYGAVQSAIYQEIINRFRSLQIEIPYPQQEIRILRKSL
ncbi:MAG: mechanosensitive ion channel protein MscS [Deltaproteobacteria bacterium HGW-Deltaproteobacteria-10]|nr:MAG: mechanosensitive ion channel protein MscS [Deltaproteobacteria bacterium HGW-Deltaproteobacteria-10]